MTNKQKLQEIRTGERNIRSYVAKEILDDIDNYEGTNDEKIKAWFGGLFQGGCQSGFISSLIYYPDTNKFFDEYSEDIEDLREEMEEEMGQPLEIGYPLKNWLAWFGFEETARKLANELNIEI